MGLNTYMYVWVYYTWYLQTHVHMQAIDHLELEIELQESPTQSDEDFELGAGCFSKVWRRKVN